MNEQLLALCALIVGLVGCLTGLFGYWLAKRQYRLKAMDLAVEWYTGFGSWAAKVIEVLVEASYLATEPSSEDKMKLCRYKISTLIEQGRFFLPNERPNDHGIEKCSAYRGYRHAALDPLVAAVQVIDGQVGTHHNKEAALIAMRKRFVSLIQDILTLVLNSFPARMIEITNVKLEDPTLGGLLPDPENVPQGAEPLLYESKSSNRSHSEVR